MIDLQLITPENHEAIRQLAVRTDQRHWVASVDKSLADAYVWQDSLFRAGFRAGVPVGFVLVFPYDQDDTRCANIVRLMVDARYQGKSYGRELLEKTVGWIGSFTPLVEIVRISTMPDNEVALALYQSQGFERGGIEAGEVALYLPLSR